MTSYSAEQVAKMFQDGSIDDLLSNFDENFLLDIASQVGFPPIQRGRGQPNS